MFYSFANCRGVKKTVLWTVFSLRPQRLCREDTAVIYKNKVRKQSFRTLKNFEFYLLLNCRGVKKTVLWTVFSLRPQRLCREDTAVIYKNKVRKQSFRTLKNFEFYLLLNCRGVKKTVLWTVFSLRPQRLCREDTAVIYKNKVRKQSFRTLKNFEFLSL